MEITLPVLIVVASVVVLCLGAFVDGGRRRPRTRDARAAEPAEPAWRHLDPSVAPSMPAPTTLAPSTLGSEAMAAMAAGQAAGVAVDVAHAPTAPRDPVVPGSSPRGRSRQLRSGAIARSVTRSQQIRALVPRPFEGTTIEMSALPVLEQQAIAALRSRKEDPTAEIAALPAREREAFASLVHRTAEGSVNMPPPREPPPREPSPARPPRTRPPTPEDETTFEVLSLRALEQLIQRDPQVSRRDVLPGEADAAATEIDMSSLRALEAAPMASAGHTAGSQPSCAPEPMDGGTC